MATRWISILVALLAWFPHGGAAYVDEHGVVHGPNEPTDHYWDPLTQTKYHYDAMTGVLSSSTQPSVLGLQINVTHLGETMIEYGNTPTDPLTIGPCGYTFCVGYVARLVGEHQVKWRFETRWLHNGQWTAWQFGDSGELEYLGGGTPLVTGGSAYDGQNNTGLHCEVRARLWVVGGDEEAVVTSCYA